jgi:hypothetical protein
MSSEKTIDMVCRQTDYTKEEAEKLLNENNNDPIKVIKIYMNINEKKEEVCTTASQERYRLIRKTLDEAVEIYNKSKDQKS